ncbi:hypothetical protein AX15_000729 [Amanita polypyramis BW_CC]|nr:hypothetical protein AX15_000729 [Amanita polypyramis BW_CC]
MFSFVRSIFMSPCSGFTSSGDACPSCGYPNNVLQTVLPEPLDLQTTEHDCYPSQLIKSTVERAIQDGEAKIAGVDGEIRRFGLILQQLTEQKKELLRDVAYKRSLISPIRRLPVELLRQVFLECLPPGDLDRSSLSVSPFVLSQVCRQWRAVAHSMPVLWSTFEVVECGWTREEGAPSPAETRFNSFIGRSGELPLSFRFSSYLKGLKERQPNIHPILSKLFQLSHRWRNTWLGLPYRAYTDDSQEYSNPLSLPELESLILENPHIAIGGFLPEGVQAVRMFSIAPRLTQLSLQKYLLPTRAFVFPWSQIRQLHLKENLIDGNDYATILREATRLEYFYAENNHCVPNLTATIVCTSIRSLTIVTKTSSSGVEPFLAPLVLPNLTFFNLRVWKPPQRDINAAVLFLERSGCSVTHFTCRSVDDGQLVQLLEKMPHLVHVDLRGSLIRPFLVKRLRYYHHREDEPEQEMQMVMHSNPDSESPSLAGDDNTAPEQQPPSSEPPAFSSPCLLPKLETLLLSDSSLTPDLAGLTDAISSRIQVSHESECAGIVSPIATLKRVKVLLRREVEATAVSQLKKFSKSEWGKRVVVGLSDKSTVPVESP